MGSKRLSLAKGPRASIFARDHSLCTTERALDRMMAGNGGSMALKNSPRVTPSAEAIRSVDAMEGEAWRSSICEMKLGEKPHLSASVRTERWSVFRKWRTRSPTCTSVFDGEGLVCLVGFFGRVSSIDGSRSGTPKVGHILKGLFTCVACFPASLKQSGVSSNSHFPSHLIRRHKRYEISGVLPVSCPRERHYSVSSITGHMLT